MSPTSQISQKLLAALKNLDNWAGQQGLQLEIVVIGAFALYLLGLELRATNDIDTLTQVLSGFRGYDWKT